MEGSILHCYRGHREQNLGILYLFKCPVPFINVTIYLVSHLLVMYNLFGSLNVVESHIKSSQSDLALYKYWVTHSFWLWLFTDVAIVMNITNCWKLFSYGVKRDYYEKLVGIRELFEWLSLDCFNNLFQTNTRTIKTSTWWGWLWRDIFYLLRPSFSQFRFSFHRWKHYLWPHS